MEMSDKQLYEFWKEDWDPGVNDIGYCSPEWWKVVEELDELLKRLVKSWRYEGNMFKNFVSARTIRMVLQSTRPVQKYEEIEGWARVHELFDKLEVPDKVRREWAKEVYWANRGKR